LEEIIQTPHPSLISGKDSKVKMAGMVDIWNGKIYSCDDRSGHFKPLLVVCVRNKFFE